MDDLTSLLKQLVQDWTKNQERREGDRELRRKDDEQVRTQLIEEMDRRDAVVYEVASGATAELVGTATSASDVRGFSFNGSLPALGEAVGLPRSGANSSVYNHRAVVRSREFGSLKQSVPKFSGKLWLGVCLRSSQCKT